MKALKKVNFDGVLFPDHVPQMAGGHGWAFTVGYVKCLRDHVEAEAAQQENNLTIMLATTNCLKHYSPFNSSLI